AAGGNIHSLEIVEHFPESAIDDFMVDLPPGVLPDSLVSAVQGVAGVRVLWVSRHHSAWHVGTDAAVVDKMYADQEHAAAILVAEAPDAFHSTWAALIDRSGEPPKVLETTRLAPDFATDGLTALGALDEVRTFELPAEWLPQWGETVVALAPVNDALSIVVGRQGGPAYLNYELGRLKHLARLAD
ncbi:MAG: amino acid-binding protein, partial [Propionibacteriaceae bacterium]|nr:amino acid-binding protein [Propionibacteriaceae bacterium]